MGRQRSALPAQVNMVRARVERWRQRRPQRSPMPEELWEAAVSLARAHGIYPIARTLRLDYGSLKRRLARFPKSRRGGGVGSAGFVEFDAAEVLRRVEPSGAVVELWGTDGTKLVVRLGGREELDPLRLVDVFRGRRA